MRNKLSHVAFHIYSAQYNLGRDAIRYFNIGESTKLSSSFLPSIVQASSVSGHVFSFSIQHKTLLLYPDTAQYPSHVSWYSTILFSCILIQHNTLLLYPDTAQDPSPVPWYSTIPFSCILLLYLMMMPSKSFSN